MKKSLLIKSITVVLFIALFILGIRLSQNKMLWNDELYSQIYGIEKLSYVEILQGKVPEGNNSPLFYALQKGICDMTGYKLPVVWKGEWGIAEPKAQVLLRLLPNFFMSLALGAVFYVFAAEYSLLAGAYAFLIAITTEMCWGYWAEARPYALWYFLSTLQALYFLRFILNKTDQKKNWRHLGIVHILLSLTAVFGAVQVFVVSMVLYVFYKRQLAQYTLLLFVPLLLGFFYFLHAPHYVFGLPPDRWSLIFENVTAQRIVLITACGFLAAGYQCWGKQRQESLVIWRFAAVVVLMFAAALAIMQCLTWTGQEGWKPFTVSSRYFIFLAPVGAVAAAVFPLEVLKMLRVERRTAMFVVGVLLLLSLIVVFKKNGAQVRSFLADNPLSLNLTAQREKVKNKAMMITINHYRPDLAVWKEFILDGKPLDKGFLKDSVQYYQTISTYVPQIAEPQYMLGLCYALSDDVPAALAAQEKAALMEPRFFWSWYNLGVLYYRQGEFAKSGQAFRKALTVPPQATVKIMGSSKIYEEVLRAMGPERSVAGTHLQQGYRDAVRMMEASIRRLRGQPAGIEEQDVQLKVF
ncbi:MAG: tetratricopeptide repeat protein [Candidatus Omnitrophica bacterium]|nr:tetratricopeptide repeat protein [Candidatus Omnitrophota bacterium]